MTVTQSFNQKQQTKILKSNGYHKVRSTGSHIIFRNEDGDTIIISNHGKGCKATSFDNTIKKFKLKIP